MYKYVNGNADLYGGEVALDVHPVSCPFELNATLSVVQGGLLNAPASYKYLPFVPPARITADLKYHIKHIDNGIKNAYIKAGMLSCFEQKDIYEQSAVYNSLWQPGTPIPTTPEYEESYICN